MVSNYTEPNYMKYDSDYTKYGSLEDSVSNYFISCNYNVSVLRACLQTRKESLSLRYFLSCCGNCNCSIIS